MMEISPVFAIPFSRTEGPTQDGPDLWYPLVATQDAGPLMFLRSYGTDFNIVPRNWLKLGLTGCYSVGPGLYEASESTIVLCQHFVARSEPLERFAQRAPDGSRVDMDVATIYGRSCVRLAMTL